MKLSASGYGFVFTRISESITTFQRFELSRHFFLSEFSTLLETLLENKFAILLF